jgi:hypothetical protein
MKKDTQELNFQEKINKAVALIDEAVAEYIMPVLEDHKKMCDYMYENRKSWNGYVKEAYTNTLSQAVACVVALEPLVRSLFTIDYKGYLQLLEASATQFELFHKTTGLAVSQTLIKKARKVADTFPLSSEIEEFEAADFEVQGALSRLITARFEAIKNIHGTPEETNNGN